MTGDLDKIAPRRAADYFPGLSGGWCIGALICAGIGQTPWRVVAGQIVAIVSIWAAAFLMARIASKWAGNQPGKE